MERLENFGRSTLTSAITDSQTSITVIDGSVFPSAGDFRINVEDELMLVTARATNTLTVTRGIESTTAAAHSSGVYVTHVATAGGVTKMIEERTVATSLFMYNNFK